MELLDFTFKSFWHFSGVFLIFVFLLIFLEGIFKVMVDFLRILFRGYPPQEFEYEEAPEEKKYNGPQYDI